MPKILKSRKPKKLRINKKPRINKKQKKKALSLHLHHMLNHGPDLLGHGHDRTSSGGFDLSILTNFLKAEKKSYQKNLELQLKHPESFGPISKKTQTSNPNPYLINNLNILKPKPKKKTKTKTTQITKNLNTNSNFNVATVGL